MSETADVHDTSRNDARPLATGPTATPRHNWEKVQSACWLKVAASSAILKRAGRLVCTRRIQGATIVHRVLFALALLCSPSVVIAQVYGTSSNLITVTIAPITVLQFSTAILNLSITGAEAVAGQNQMILTDESSTLSWGTNSSAQKITVSTNLASPLFTLQVEPKNWTGGTPMPPVTLTTTPTDFLRDIGRSSGTCTLLYTVTALASKGTGTDAHTLTFTVQGQ